MERPTAVTVFGILNLIFAGLGVMGVISSLAMLWFKDHMPPNPMLTLMQENAVYSTFLKVSIPLGLVSSLLLLLGGIGLLRLKPWGRTLSIVYAILAIISGVVSGAISFMIIVPELSQSTGEGPGAASAAGIVGAVAGSFFAMIYPILVLIFMNRPKLKAAFRSTPPPLSA